MRVIVGSVVRRRVAGILAIALAAALLFGVGVAAFAGARRSSGAIDRLVAYSTPEDAYIGSLDESPYDVEAVQALPEVVASIYQGYVAMVPIGPDGEAQLDQLGSINPYLYLPASGPPGAINRLRIVAGRDLDPAAPLEVVVDEEVAAARGLRVGSHLPMGTYTTDQDVFSDEGTEGDVEPEGPVVDLEVVGIARMPVDVHPSQDEHTTSFGGMMDMYLSPAFASRFGDDIVAFGITEGSSALAVRLTHGAADLDAVREELRALPGGDGLLADSSDSDAAGSVLTARQAIRVETGALLAVAALLGVAGALVLAQAVVRLAQTVTPELSVLRAVGMGRRALLVTAVAPAAVGVVVGALLSVVAALAFSPRTPIGLARQAELDVGVHLDPTATAVGVGVILVVGGAGSFLGAARAARSAVPGAPRGSYRRSFADRLAAVGAPTTSVLGARLATGGPRTARGLLRSGTFSVALALLGIGAAATFAASLQHLDATPAAQGASWDLAMGNINLSDFQDEDVEALLAEPVVGGVAEVAAPQGGSTVDGRATPLVGFDSFGGVSPPLLAGRLPTAMGEVTLGNRTADDLGVSIGDRVTVDRAGASTDAVVVGTALVGPAITPPMLIGDGALVTVEQMRALFDEQPVNFLLVDTAPGVSVPEARDALGPAWGDRMDVPVRAADVVNLLRVRGIPTALAATLAAAALVLEGAALAIAHRRRQATFATLRALGATRRQHRAVLGWQATWLYLAATVVGLPLGLVAGAVLWRQVAGDIGVLLDPIYPLAVLVAVVATGLLLTVGVGVAPAVVGRRDDVAGALRTE